VIYKITPTPKPRMSRQDRWPNPPPKYRGKEWPRPCVRRYRNFENLCAINHVSFPPIGVKIVFVLPMPKGWSKNKKEKMNNRFHQVRPDLSNLLKALEDATYKDDSVICDVHARKIWGHEGQIIIDTP